MAYVASEARRELLDDVAEATDRISVAIAALGDAYELLDEQTADRLEDELFRPLQTAYGRAKRTHAAFAERHRIAPRDFAPARSGMVSHSPGELVERAVEAAAEADELLAELQDSMRPVEVGDAELRAGLAEVRRLLGDVPGRARAVARVLGR